MFFSHLLSHYMHPFHPYISVCALLPMCFACSTERGKTSITLLFTVANFSWKSLIDFFDILSWSWIILGKTALSSLSLKTYAWCHGTQAFTYMHDAVHDATASCIDKQRHWRPHCTYTQVLYICVSFWRLTPKSRDLSQAETEITLAKSCTNSQNEKYFHSKWWFFFQTCPFWVKKIICSACNNIFFCLSMR